LREDPNNIAILCSKCHAAEHPGLAFISIPRLRTGKFHVCQVCGHEYYRPPYIVKTRFCSRACKHEMQRGHPWGRYYEKGVRGHGGINHSS
jgi:hypothetical protein